VKGRASPFYDPWEFRLDHYGTLMRWSDYGNRNSEFGWEFGHVRAAALGGTDGISNLRPINWKNNIAESPLIAALAKGFGRR
jgi:hypothetical protein